MRSSPNKVCDVWVLVLDDDAQRLRADWQAERERDPKRIDNDDTRENVFWKAWQETQSLIAATPATSPAGVAVKLRQILAEEASDAADDAALKSALADLERM